MSWLYSVVFAGLVFSANGGGHSGSAFLQKATESTAAMARSDETERFEQSYPLSPKGRVSVSNVNGSIVLEAWDRSEVKLEAVKTADSKETLADVEIKVDARPDSFSVEADYGTWNRTRGGDWKNGRRIDVQFRLMVPRAAVLNEIETVNGSVTVSNFTNFTKISAVNGNVVATNLRGAAELSTVNGEVSADFERLDTTNRISLSTVNGRANLVIPSDANATIKADSLNGNITNDFGLPVRKGKYIGRDLFGRVGTGEIQIKLSSVNGHLGISRRNDGRTVNPATNLLNQKKDGDEDWEDGSQGLSGPDHQKINRDIAKAMKHSHKESTAAMKEAQKASAAAMKDVEKELAKIKPELGKIDVDLPKVLAEINTENLREQVRESVARRQVVLAKMDDLRWRGNAPTIMKKSNSFPVKGAPKVTLDAKGCGVTIRGWDKPEVKYVLTEFSESRDRTTVSVEEKITESTVSIKVVNAEHASSPGFHLAGAQDFRLDVYVPKRSDLNVSTDGEIRLDGVTGELRLNGEDEAINIRDSGGTLTLSAADGDVRVVGFNGDLDSKTVDGDVYLEGTFNKLNSVASDGTIILTVPGSGDISFVSNTDVTTEGLTLKRANEKVWELGRGGTRYNFAFADGSLIVRSASMLNGN